MNLNNKSHIFLDIDGVMVVGRLLYSNKTHPEYDGSPFDKKCVGVLNAIIEEINPVIIISSDWKDHFDIEELNKIFELNEINETVTDITPTLWGVDYSKLEELEECRANEILSYINEHKISNYVAIDDLDLSEWIPEGSFLRTPRSMEGLKQSGAKQKIIKYLNSN